MIHARFEVVPSASFSLKSYSVSQIIMLPICCSESVPHIYTTKRQTSRYMVLDEFRTDLTIDAKRFFSLGIPLQIVKGALNDATLLGFGFC